MRSARICARTPAEGLAENTARRRCGIAKQFFRAAVRRGHVTTNPFDGLPTLVRENPKRFHFVTREESEAVLAACSDAE
jgi:site-specific recombinase XerC